ncbi:MAG: hypothetical protein LBP25_03690 [Tannerellaceae bacterium]|jgi:hypothetical protein|nr:hypothetical protein [Tannerellaceae bacterium]
MNKKKNLLWMVSFLMAFRAFSQVGIGIEKPDSASILEIKSSNKGVLIPRVMLKSIKFDLDSLPGQPTGLLIYNKGGVLAEGFYFWNGAEWENLVSSTTIDPKIDGLDCSHALLEPQTFAAGVAYVGILRVPYVGGNGGKYPARECVSAISGNTGLKACLKAGILEQGRGYLVYDVTGTPTSSSPVGATFPISFGNHTCQVTVGDIESATMTSTFSVGPLIPVAGTTNNFQRVVTSFDGKFSVRIYVNGGSLSNGYLQIRHNVSSNITIMWNGLTSTNSLNGSANNQYQLTHLQSWYGAWGPNNISIPEQRSYIWTTTDVTDKTVYHLTVMIGSSTPGSISANAENMKNTNIFLKIEQIQAN